MLILMTVYRGFMQSVRGLKRRAADQAAVFLTRWEGEHVVAAPTHKQVIERAIVSE